MKLRPIKAGEKWKYYHIFTADQVFRNVYCCLIDGTLWFNGRDGYFYTHIKPTKIDSKNLVTRSNTNIETRCRSLEFVADNMRTGFDMNGQPICHRKNYFGRHRNPLRAATIVTKNKK